MIILSIDTSCDETSVAVTSARRILSNVLWSQASLHSSFGGVYPSLAKRAHQERIDWVIEKALKRARFTITDIYAVSVTVGPGLAVALEVGIEKAKQLARQFRLPFICVNHVEGHLLSVIAQANNQKKLSNNFQFPALSLVASGKHADIILVKKIGDYELVAHTVDDAVGEALDKAARMLGLGYPGGAILEKLAKNGNPEIYSLPLPLEGQEHRMEFSYSGLKTAMYRLVEKEKPLTKEKIQNLAAIFQDRAFKHIERIVIKALEKHPVKDFVLGGGVSANLELRKRIRKICTKKGIKLWLPYNKNLCGDNAAMIGISAYYKFLRKEYLKPTELDKVDRVPRAPVDKPFSWE